MSRDPMEYFDVSSLIKQLIKENRTEEAEKILFGKFLKRLFPAFVKDTKKNFGEFPLTTIHGIDSYIQYLERFKGYDESMNFIMKKPG